MLRAASRLGLVTCCWVLGALAACAEVSGLEDLEFVDEPPACVPVDSATACADLACGTADDGCGGVLACPDTCPTGLTCGAGEVLPGECGCSGAPITPASCTRAYVAMTTGTASAYYVCTLDGGTFATWLESRDFCAAMGAHLAAMPSAEERDIVLSLLDGKKVHVGLDDLVVEGSFVWADGTPLQAADWPNVFAPGEPNDADGAEDCVEMSGDTGKLNDIPCANTNNAIRFVCEAPCG